MMHVYETDMKVDCILFINIMAEIMSNFNRLNDMHKSEGTWIPTHCDFRIILEIDLWRNDYACIHQNSLI
jgi:hypothetical protein